MQAYTAPDWTNVLHYNGLVTFDDFWQLDAGWYEPPNRRRGGWSGVSRCALNLPEGGTVGIFLKRQENHTSRSWARPVRGILTFTREIANLIRFQQYDIPSLTPVFFEQRTKNGDEQAVIVTAELSGYRSLEDLTTEWRGGGRPNYQKRLQLIQAVANTVRRMHEHRLQHRCLFPKHILVKFLADNGIDVRIIDLEKTKWRPLRIFATLRDLDTLSRRSIGWSRPDRLRFLLAYYQAKRLSPQIKRVWRYIERKGNRKIIEK